jgi:hypothetical protein
MWLVVIQIPLFWNSTGTPPNVDFGNYYAAARVGQGHGWAAIYDPALQRQAYTAARGTVEFDWRHLFVSPPPLAWLAVPFTPLPFTAAYWIWVALSAGLLAVAAWFACPGRPCTRVAVVLVGMGLYPVLIALQFGQITPLIAASTVGAWLCLRRERPVLAAAFLLPLLLKPQVGILIPVALLVAGHRRLFVAWAAMAAVVAAVSAVSLGTAGIHDWMADLATEQSHADNQQWTAAYLVGTGPAATIVQVAAAVIGLAAAWRARGQSIEIPIVAGYLASLLAAGYHHSIDYPGLLVAALLFSRTLPGRWAVAGGVVAVLACSATPRFGPGPLLVIQLAWLLLCLRSANHRERVPIERAAAVSEAMAR